MGGGGAERRGIIAGGPRGAPGAASAAMGAILASVANGDLTPGEGSAIAGLVEGYRKALETTEFEARLQAVEGRQP